MNRQEQFLDVIDRDEARRRFDAAVPHGPLGEILVPLDAALGRVLSRDIRSPVDVPMFDRSNFDGFALRAADTVDADEEHPRGVRLVGPPLTPGIAPTRAVGVGESIPVATGAMIPRGADAVLMVEFSDAVADRLAVRRAVPPGFGITYTGTDIAADEVVLRRGERLTSRETGVAAAVGIAHVWVFRTPRVAILSTGDELVEPGAPIRPGLIYDSNQRVLADAVREVGCEPSELGIRPDRFDELAAAVDQALDDHDAVLLSGGTSKSDGDVSYRVAGRFRDPGIVAHGVALKPGKPICLAVSRGKPVVVLPGFPTSAIFTFHEFVAPALRRMAGLGPAMRETVRARLAAKINSEIGRTEYVLVGLIERSRGDSCSAKRDTTGGKDAHPRWAAYPMGKGSGSVTAFGRADGFVTIARQVEIVDAGEQVDVQLLGCGLVPADLVVIGSHCLGLDWLLGALQGRGWRTKLLNVGSMGGLDAVRRGECDLAAIHLFDAESGSYNVPFLAEGLECIPGYGRVQGIVFRPGDARFEGRTVEQAMERAKTDPACVMVNRNAGSGTRILIDRLLAGARPNGYAIGSRSHNAVAASVDQQRADWGVAIEGAARRRGLGFVPIAEERYDFIVPRARLDRPPVRDFIALLREDATRAQLRAFDLRPD
ncbi:MAG: molybdopterin biosynthesis protein [Planctomycetes bacterium]|nr:molybdopterin biosynthesis protein [Planctomycetota bacterium]